MSEEIKHQNEDIDKSYDLLTDREHVLIRPTVYIGSVLTEQFQDYIYEEIAPDSDERKPHFVSDVSLTYSRGVITLINEILNNSYDEYIRTLPLVANKRLTEIVVEVDKKTGMFKVTDNGGIPVQQHTKHKMLLPTMLFGHLRSGSNYGENRGKVSGTNGVGASLVNVFSTRFEVITNDTKKTYHGVWSENMLKHSFEKVRDEKKTKGYTTIIAYLDFKRLGVDGFTDDLIKKLQTRCIEVAAMGADHKKPLTVKFKVYEGGKLIINNAFKYNEFTEYTSLFGLDPEHYQGISTENYDFIVGVNNSDSTESIAILNSVRTDFGTHIDLASNKIINHVREFMEKKHKISLTHKQVKDRLKFISRWSIPEPSFSAQIKDKLTTPPKDFGFDVDLNTKFTKWLEKSELVQRLIDFYQKKSKEDEAIALRKAQNKKTRATHIEKLIDASSKNRKECMIFIAEGDSAMNGVRASRNAETQGAFCVGGKFINAFDKKPMEIIKVKGKEDASKAKNLMDALGLNFGGGIDDIRYGQICIMTDADYDGYGIACQLVLFLRKYWKELFDAGMVYRVLSPIMVARKGTDVKVYYTMKDYEKEAKFLEKNKYKAKHIKGLASLREEEYEDVIQNPRLQQIVCDDKDMETLEAWFSNGVGSEAIRKEYIKTNFEY